MAVAAEISSVGSVTLDWRGSTFSFETSVFQALSAGKGTAPLRLASVPRLAPAIEPYCHCGWGLALARATLPPVNAMVPATRAWKNAFMASPRKDCGSVTAALRIAKRSPYWG
jgi:hypothetical protein